MHIALVHSSYRSASPSGENAVVEASVDALRRAGHRVSYVGVDSDDMYGVGDSVRAGLRVATGRGRSPLEALRSSAPDVVHVHNTFPGWSRAWVPRSPAPVVVTVHNFRFACAIGRLHRQGSRCTLCPDRGVRHAVRHACYRDSRWATLPLAIAARGPAVRDPLLGGAAAVLTMSQRAAAMLRAGGLGPQVELVDNFLPDHLRQSPSVEGGQRLVWLGRLEREKGILELLQRWPAGLALDVLGDGPLLTTAREVAPASVVFHRRVSRREALDRLARARALVFSSIGDEMDIPLVALEAASVGTPVVATGVGDASAAVVAAGLGVRHGSERLTEPSVWAELKSLRAGVVAVFERRFTERRHVERLEAVYERVQRSGVPSG